MFQTNRLISTKTHQCSTTQLVFTVCIPFSYFSNMEIKLVLWIIVGVFQVSLGYEVGNMFTEFKVEQGQAKYKVPVPTPKGFPTHLLEVDLVYDSGGGSGPLGLGWTISGLAQISR